MPKKPTDFTENLYVYVTPKGKKHVKGFGKKTFGSASAYVNDLITKDMQKVTHLATRKKQVKTISKTKEKAA